LEYISLCVGKSYALTFLNGICKPIYLFNNLIWYLWICTSIPIHSLAAV